MGRELLEEENPANSIIKACSGRSFVASASVLNPVLAAGVILYPPPSISALEPVQSLFSVI